MKSNTNIQTVGLAGAICFVFMWLMTFFEPALMATLPAGGESAITTIFTFFLALCLPEDFLQSKGPSNDPPTT